MQVPSCSLLLRVPEYFVMNCQNTGFTERRLRFVCRWERRVSPCRAAARGVAGQRRPAPDAGGFAFFVSPADRDGGREAALRGGEGPVPADESQAAGAGAAGCPAVTRPRRPRQASGFPSASCPASRLRPPPLPPQPRPLRRRSVERRRPCALGGLSAREPPGQPRPLTP